MPSATPSLDQTLSLRDVAWQFDDLSPPPRRGGCRRRKLQSGDRLVGRSGQTASADRVRSADGRTNSQGREGGRSPSHIADPATVRPPDHSRLRGESAPPHAGDPHENEPSAVVVGVARDHVSRPPSGRDRSRILGFMTGSQAVGSFGKCQSVALSDPGRRGSGPALIGAPEHGGVCIAEGVRDRRV